MYSPRVLSCFDKHVLRKEAVSFDKLRTNGHFIEGLSMTGINPFALSLSKGAPPLRVCEATENEVGGLFQRPWRYVNAG